MLFVVITPVAAFVSDHALAAMFLPIGMLLYENSLTKDVPEDPNLGKLLMMSIVMACNIGGPGAPSGGAAKRHYGRLPQGYVRGMTSVFFSGSPIVFPS